MKERSDGELDLLLSAGRLKGPAAARVLEGVLAALPPERRPWWTRLRLLLAGATLATGAAATVLLLVFAGPPAGPGDASRVKGAGVIGGPGFELSCSGGTPVACPRGSRVSVVTTGVAAATPGFLGAFAEPQAGGERIWYFSAEDGTAEVTAGEGSSMASRSVVLGAEHAGSYLVHVVLARRPLTRAELMAPDTRDVVGRAQLSLRVTDP